MNVLVLDRTHRIANLVGGLARGLDCYPSTESEPDAALGKLETGLFDGVIAIVDPSDTDMVNVLKNAVDLIPRLPILFINQGAKDPGLESDCVQIEDRPVRPGMVMTWLRKHERDIATRHPEPVAAPPEIKVQINGSDIEVRALRINGGRLLMSPLNRSELEIDHLADVEEVTATIRFSAMETEEVQGTVLFVEEGVGDTVSGIGIRLQDEDSRIQDRLAAWLAA